MFATLIVVMCAAPTPLPLPGGDGGIGFDDLGYSPELGKVLVPAGRTGKLDLIDPKTLAVDSIGGFSESTEAHGHGDGTTSAAFGAGLLFASDRGGKQVVVIDPKQKKIVSKTALEAGPDYVRWVEPNKEVWVTEPKTRSIEWFKLEGTTLKRGGSITVDGGPESLVVDATRSRAYTHTWKEESVAIDLKTHKEAARWKNGCKESRGIALDEPAGWLFIGCDEGAATVIDVGHGGKPLAKLASPKGVDIIAYDPKLKHLYVPGGDDAKMSVMEVDASAALHERAQLPTAHDATCVTVDGNGRVYVCDPKAGRLLVFEDH
jgi:DNA-binding beta-propeller fold protein YncE